MSHSRGLSDTRTIHVDGPLFRDPPSRRRRFFPNGWQDAMYAAFTLAGLALAFLFASAGWAVLAPVVTR